MVRLLAEQSLEAKETSSARALTIKMDTVIILLLSLMPFNFSDVDKTGLDLNIDNGIDKVARVIWFLVSVITVLVLKPVLYKRIFLRSTTLVKFLIFYMAVILIGLVANGIGVIGYYRLCEYLILILALNTLSAAIEKYGKDFAVELFSRWVLFTAVLVLLVITFGLTVSPHHFYALETQGRLRLGGNAYSPNFIGMVFGLGSLAAFYLYCGASKFTTKLVFAVWCIALLVALYFTGSRTAQFSVVIAFVAWFFFSIGTGSKVFLVLSGLVFLVPLGFIFHESLVASVLPMIGKGETPTYDLLTLNNRSVVAEVGLQGAFENWGLGVGFVEGVKQYYRSNFTQSYWLPPHTHNAIIESFLSGGIISLLIMVVILGGVLRSLIGCVFFKKNRSAIFLAVFSIPLVLGCITMTIFGGVYTVLTFWFFSLALFSWSKNERKNPIYI